MATAPPTPRTWVLRFKNKATTILVHVDPLESMMSVKAKLLKAVQDTHPSGVINEYRIPKSAEEVVLARPLDAHDIKNGFVRIDQIEIMEDVSVTDAKGKGKAVANSKATLKKLEDCPQGQGLRDGGLVAFKFAHDSDWEKVKKGDEDDEFMVDESEDWDVVVPTMEETYGA